MGRRLRELGFVADEPVKFYRATLRLYMIGIATAFLSLIAAAFL